MNKEIININIVGDFFLPSVNRWKLDSQLKDILSKADLNVANFEAPIKTRGSLPAKKSGPSLNQDPLAPSWLEDNGFNVISLANNHIFDYGTEAVSATLESFSDNTTLVGGGDFKDVYSLKLVTVKGKRIGFLAITQYEFGVFDDEAYSDNRVGSAWMCHPLIDEVIIHAHEQCDYLILIPHAGLEHFYFPLPELRTLYRHFVNIGADAVIASHPHIAQPWEMFNGHPIAYSLGNFCFDLPVANCPLWSKGLMASLKISSEDGICLFMKQVGFNYEDKSVSFLDDLEYSAFLEKINHDFCDEKKFVDAVNEQCLKLAPMYSMVMEMGGYSKVTTLRKSLSLVKQQLTSLLKKRKIVSNDAHFINTMRCETHRWVMSRIYELQNKIK